MKKVKATTKTFEINRTDTMTLYVEVCCACNVVFAMPKELEENRRATGNTFYCPNGHSLVYNKEPSQTEREAAERVKRLEAQLAKANEVKEWLSERLDSTSAELKDTSNKLRGQKAAHTRLKNRVANGVCPCCNRSFVNLHRHMETQHPDFVAEE